jgi:hypothetical protein
MYSQFGVPLDVEKGLLSLLRLTVSSQAAGAPSTVITRDPHLWATEYPESGMTLLDVSPLMPFEPPDPALKASTLELQVKRRLIAAGWPSDRIKEQYAMAAGASLRTVS